MHRYRTLQAVLVLVCIVTHSSAMMRAAMISSQTKALGHRFTTIASTRDTDKPGQCSRSTIPRLAQLTYPLGDPCPVEYIRAKLLQRSNAALLLHL